MKPVCDGKDLRMQCLYFRMMVQAAWNRFCFLKNADPCSLFYTHGCIPLPLSLSVPCFIACIYLEILNCIKLFLIPWSDISISMAYFFET